MPRPLPAPGTPEAAFYRKMVDAPNDSGLASVLADLREEAGDTNVPGVLRAVNELRGRFRDRFRLAQPTHLALVRGADLDDADCAPLVPPLRTLLDAGPYTVTQAMLSDIEWRLSALLGRPDPEGEASDLRSPEGLRSQYDLQRALLASLDLVTSQGDQLGITGIDGQFHPLPALDVIQARLESPALRQKVEQGFDQLLLVPFALPLKHLLDAWRQGLLRNRHMLKEHGGLNRKEPLWVCEAFMREDLVYFPQRFAADHGGQTKTKLLAASRNVAGRRGSACASSLGANRAGRPRRTPWPSSRRLSSPGGRWTSKP
jgi:hypothetical protein